MSQTTDQLTREEQEYFITRGESGLPETGNMNGPDENLRPEEDQRSEDSGIHKNRTVPHGALHAEREEHKKTRTELQNLRVQTSQIQQEFQAVMAAIQNQEQKSQTTVPPDPREDFLGFTRWHADEIKRLETEIAENRRREEDVRRSEKAEQALWSEWNQSVERMRDECKDLDEALDFLAQTRDHQLGILAQLDSRFGEKGFREEQLRAELRDIVVAAFQEGKEPAKAVYDIAKAYGYGDETSARFIKLGNAQAASRTLTSSAGKEAGDPMLLETVANLPEAEFARWYENNRDTFRKMFGG